MIAPGTWSVQDEFRRQIYLCSGISKKHMLEIVAEQWDRGTELYPCPKCGKLASFFDGSAQHKCGVDSPSVFEKLKQASHQVEVEATKRKTSRRKR